MNVVIKQPIKTKLLNGRIFKHFAPQYSLVFYQVKDFMFLSIF